jgi:hypothetical protein
VGPVLTEGTRLYAAHFTGQTGNRPVIGEGARLPANRDRRRHRLDDSHQGTLARMADLLRNASQE